VIAHIDLDAFYAQCEMVRLGVPEDKPLAVQQWYARLLWRRVFSNVLKGKVL
jgi:nucleotidyltransferase/DNA polymerase involved in DNA repair